MLVKRRRKFKVSGRKCFCCGALSPLSDHHINPRELGGTDERRNLVTLCLTCHDEVEGMENELSAGDIWQRIIRRKESFRIARICEATKSRPRNRNGHFGAPSRPVAAVKTELLKPGEFWARDGKHVWGVDVGVVYCREATEHEVTASPEDGRPDVLVYMSLKTKEERKQDNSLSPVESLAA